MGLLRGSLWTRHPLVLKEEEDNREYPPTKTHFGDDIELPYEIYVTKPNMIIRVISRSVGSISNIYLCNKVRGGVEYANIP